MSHSKASTSSGPSGMGAKRDRPWMIRTYSGYSSAKESNALYKLNLSKGQTGLSVAFDLPTQVGYDPDHPMARGEVGKVGVSIAHIEDMEQLFEGISLDQINTSMTINATAPWLLSLYIAVAQRQGIELSALRGTTQNDLIKEYLSRGLYIFPPQHSMRLMVDVISYTVQNIPRWNPINICSYHLQEAGATPVQELAFALATAMGILDAVKASGQVPKDRMARVAGRLSFFVNAGIRFIEETCKMRAFTSMWDDITKNRYDVTDPKLRRFRYGVQVNSLGLTEQQPENNIQRIVVQALGVLLSKKARARALQLPAWNEAIGLPRPWDQQWSLRIQQILAYETDLLELDDILDGSHVIEAKVKELTEAAWAEIREIEAEGGIIPSVESGLLKRKLVSSQLERMRAIERGDIKIVGVNEFRQTEDSPLTSGADGGFMKVSSTAEQEIMDAFAVYKAKRDNQKAKLALTELYDVAKSGTNIMDASIKCAHAGVTTGEWANTLRRAFGEFRAPTGTDITHQAPGNQARESAVRQRVQSTVEQCGRPPRLLVAKPGLEGHSNGAEQIALKAQSIGFEVIFKGIRQTSDDIIKSVRDEKADLLGLSMLSGSHLELTETIVAGLRKEGLEHVKVIAGGIIPPEDEPALQKMGVAAVFTPKDFDLNEVSAILLDVFRAKQSLPALGPLITQ